MAVLKVYSRTHSICYKARLLSKATLVHVLTLLVRVILPMIIASRIRGFWPHMESFNEQPDIRFKGDYLLIGKSTEFSEPLNPLFVCSSFLSDEIFKDNCSLIESEEYDFDLDRRIDQFRISFLVQSKNQILNTLFILLPIELRIKGACPFTVQTALIFKDPITIQSHGHIVINSDLDLVLRTPLNFCNFVEVPPKKLPLQSLADLIPFYTHKNVQLVNTFTLFEWDDAVDCLNVTLHVRIPNVFMFYKPDIWQQYRSIWIQYLALFFIVSWLMNYVKRFIFEHKYVLYYQDTTQVKN